MKMQKIKRLSWVLLCLLLPISALAQNDNNNNNAVLATIADESITLNDLQNYAHSSPLLRGYLQAPGGPERLLDNLILERLLLREGERRQIPRLTGELAKDDFPYIQKIHKQLVKPCPPPNEQDLRDFYKANPARFSTPLFLRLRRIGLTATPTNITAISATLQQLRQRLDAGEISFEQAVAQYSEDKISQDRQGDIGFVPIKNPTDSDSVWRHFVQANADDIIGPVEEQNAVYLYQVTERRQPILGDFVELREQVLQDYRQVCQENALQAVVTELKQRWPVTHNRDKLKPSLAPVK